MKYKKNILNWVNIELRAELILGRSTTEYHDLLRDCPSKPEDIETFYKAISESEGYKTMCINGELYVDCGSNVFKVNAVGVDTQETKYPIDMRVNYVDENGAATSEPTVTVPHGTEFKLEVALLSGMRILNCYRYVCVTGAYLKDGTLVSTTVLNERDRLSLYYNKRNKNRMHLVPYQDNEAKAFVAKIPVTESGIVGVSGKDPEQLGFGLIYGLAIPASGSGHFGRPALNPLLPTRGPQSMGLTAAAELGVGSTTIGHVSQGSLLELHFSEAAAFKVRVRTTLDGVNVNQFTEIRELVANLEKLQACCAYCGTVADSDVASVVLDDGVLTVKVEGECAGCRARNWDVMEPRYIPELRYDETAEVAVCGYCSGALPGVTIQYDETGQHIISTEGAECPGCRSEEVKIVEVPKISAQ